MNEDMQHLNFYERFVKRLHRLFLTILSSKCKSLFIFSVLLNAIGVLVLSFYSYNVTKQLRIEQGNDYCSNDYNNNIGHKSFNYHLCIPPIDAVYTWVNGSDPIWFEEMTQYKLRYLEEKGENTTELIEQDNSISINRYRDNDELKYSLRSLEKYAPWIRKVYLVTNGQVPSWLDLSNKKIQVVTHKEIFTNQSHLPTFSSPAIETHLHQIPGLSEWFLYFNDDVMLGSPVWPQDFMTIEQGQKFFSSWETPKCAEYCNWEYLGDGYCDKACNVKECMFDLGDCKDKEPESTTNDSGTSTDDSNTNSYTYGHGSPYSSTQYQDNGKPKSKGVCKTGCPANWLGDGTCDKGCNNIECGFDGFDCGIDMYQLNIYTYNQEDISTYNLQVNSSIYSQPTYSLYDKLEATHPLKIILSNSTETNSPIFIDGRFKYAFFDLSILVQNHTLMTVSIQEDFEVHQAVVSEYYQSLVIVFTTLYNETVSEPFHMTITVSDNKHQHILFNYTLIRVPFTLEFIDLWSPLPNMHSYICTLSEITEQYESMNIPLLSNTHPSILLHPLYFKEQFDSNLRSNNLIWRDSSSPSFLISNHSYYQIDININNYLEIYSHQNDTLSTDYNTMIRPSESPSHDDDYDILYSFHFSDYLSLFKNINTNNTSQLLYLNSSVTILHPSVLNNMQHYFHKSTFSSYISQPVHIGTSNSEFSTLYSIHKPKHTCKSMFDHYFKGSSIFTNISLSFSYNTCIYKRIHIPSRHILHYLYPNITTIDLCIPGIQTLICEIDNEMITNNEYYYKTISNYIISNFTEDHNSKNIYYLIQKKSLNKLRYHYKEEMDAVKYMIRMDLDLKESTEFLQSQCNSNEEMEHLLYSILDKYILSNHLSPVLSLNDTSQYLMNHLREIHIDGLSESIPSLLSYVRNTLHRSNLVQSPSNTEDSNSINAVMKNDTGIMLAYHYIDKQIHMNNITLSLDHPIIRRYFTLRFGTSDFEEIHNILTHQDSTIHNEYDDEKEEEEEDSIIDDEDLEENIDYSLLYQEYEQYLMEQEGRRLVDTYRESLIYTIKQFLNTYGKIHTKPRVPAHMPHMLNKNILNELQSKYANEFEKTSSHRFRDVEDMQYAFSYFWYLKQRSKKNETEEIRQLWNLFVDTDKDGIANKNEYHTLLTMISDNKMEQDLIHRMSECIAPEAVLVTEFEDYDGSYQQITKFRPSVTYDQFVHCKEAVDAVQRNVIQKQKFDFSTLTNHIEDHVDDTDDSQVAFEMINDDYNFTLNKLNSIRARHSRFICINDDMSDPSTEVLQLLHDFYVSFFPYPSQFELNRHLTLLYSNIDLYKRKLFRERNRSYYYIIIVGGLFGISMLVTYLLNQAEQKHSKQK